MESNYGSANGTHQYVNWGVDLPSQLGSNLYAPNQNGHPGYPSDTADSFGATRTPQAPVSPQPYTSLNNIYSSQQPPSPIHPQYSDANSASHDNNIRFGNAMFGPNMNEPSSGNGIFYFLEPKIILPRKALQSGIPKMERLKIYPLSPRFPLPSSLVLTSELSDPGLNKNHRCLRPLYSPIDVRWSLYRYYVFSIHSRRDRSWTYPSLFTNNSLTPHERFPCISLPPFPLPSFLSLSSSSTSYRNNTFARLSRKF